MRFALLGYAPNSIPLLEAIAASDDHSLQVIAEVSDEQLAELLQRFPSARSIESWEGLLTESNLDRVIVAGSHESVTVGARQIANEGTPVVLCPQAAQGSAFVYGLSLVHDDNSVPLFPLNELWSESQFRELASRIADGELGEVSLLRIDRSILPLDTNQEMLTQADVDHALLSDVMVLRKIAGAFNRVTAVYTGAVRDKLSQATVTLAGEEIPEAMWTVQHGDPVWKLTVVGAKANAVLTLDFNAQREHQLGITPKDGEKVEISQDRDSSQQLLLQQAAAEHALLADWQETIRSFETVEATHASLRRRRTIDLYFETTSERSIFKAQMTAVGCGLIMLTLFGLVAFLLLGAFLDSRSIAQRRAQADGRVIETVEWKTGAAELSEHGENRIAEISRQLEATPRSVFVMPEVGDQFEELNESRRKLIVGKLSDRGRTEAIQFVEFAKVPSAFAQTTLEILRLAWIAPLVLFLILQSLLMITRPSAKESDSVAGSNNAESDKAPEESEE